MVRFLFKRFTDLFVLVLFGICLGAIFKAFIEYNRFRDVSADAVLVVVVAIFLVVGIFRDLFG